MSTHIPPAEQESIEYRNEAAATEADERLYSASQWQLIRHRFKQHKLAMASGVVLILVYLVAIFAEFVAMYDPTDYDVQAPYSPPQRIRLVGSDGFRLRPFVYGLVGTMDRRILEQVYVIDKTQVHYLRLFGRGQPYKLWGLWTSDIHLLATTEGQRVYLLGTDRMGRDLYSRIIYGTRISVSIGLIGVFISLFLGVLLGGISGYVGGIADNVIQRIIELLRSIPTIPLWMALSAALPAHWSPVFMYFGITIILSLLGWTDLARVVRSKFISIREEQFVIAARLYGTGRMRVILRHMVPSFTSHIIAVMTIRIPQMILGETSLSFLGLGMQEPAVSWGVLLKDAQNVRVVAKSPWLLIPAIMVIVTVLAFSFLGDGMRDAADPYSAR